jgi:enoyl-CoA hydratase
MSFQTLLIEDRDAVRLVTVNRPDRLNALDQLTIAELREAFAGAAADAGVRAVVLTGAGAKAFVAGADIAQMSGLSPEQARAFSWQGQQLMLAIERLGKPAIAMINGFALGGGMELAMACHLRFAADTARLGQPEVNLGLIPGFGGTQRLLRLAGRGAALELCLGGAPIGAQRAFELGLVQRVLPADQLQEQTLAFAAQLTQAAPLAVRAILETVVQGGDAALEAALALESQAFGLVFASKDMREGTAAFLEKRKPQFRGE